MLPKHVVPRSIQHANSISLAKTPHNSNFYRLPTIFQRITPPITAWFSNTTPYPFLYALHNEWSRMEQKFPKVSSCFDSGILFIYFFAQRGSARNFIGQLLLELKSCFQMFSIYYRLICLDNKVFE